MNEKPSGNDEEERTAFSQQVGAKVARKLQAQRNAGQSVWFGLGMTGLIGWSVVVPTLLGAALGNWLDNHYASPYSWTLTLLIAGLAIGCGNAWHWVAQEVQTIREEQKDHHD